MVKARTVPVFPSQWKRLAISRTNLDLNNTLPVGQSFLWHQRTVSHGSDDQQQRMQEFSRAIDSPPRVLCLRQTLNDIWFTSVNPGETSDEQGELDSKWLRDYFQLDTQPSLEKLYEEWRKLDPEVFGKTVVGDTARGVRVLRQDPWECLLA